MREINSNVIVLKITNVTFIGKRKKLSEISASPNDAFNKTSLMNIIIITLTLFIKRNKHRWTFTKHSTLICKI